MKITNEVAYAALEAIQPLLSKEGMGARTSYRVFRLASALEAAIAPAEKARAKVLGEHVVKGEDGEPVPVKDEAGKVLEGQVRLTAEGGKELADLFAIEVDVDAEPLTLDELEPAGLAPIAIGRLGPFVTAD